MVFGIFKRDVKVYIEIVPDAKRKTLQGNSRGHIDPETVSHSDDWRGYSGLVDLGFK